MKKMLHLIALLSCVVGLSHTLVSSQEVERGLNLSLEEISEKTLERSKKSAEEDKSLPNILTPLVKTIN